MKNLTQKIMLAVALAISVSSYGQTGTTAATGTVSGKTELIEKVEAVPGKAIISYEKYRLANGLTVLVHEDHSDPVVHVEVTYKVGSNRETGGKSGFAHFFEHMMFQGSENVADEEHFKIVQGAGGTMNGTTSRDRTNYYETVPANMLETALWLESDRMGFLLPAFTKKKFEVQRSTVKNEKDQSYGQPYGQTSEIMGQLLYPPGHPYSWQTIGYVDDLDRADSNDLKNFFLRWYGPNNAILVVAGDVNTANVIKMVEKYFGSISRGAEVAKLNVPRNVLPESVTKTVYDDVYFPLNDIVYPTVPAFNADEPALDLLAELLDGGKNSVFYKNFIKTERALQTSINNSTSELSGEFNIAIVSYDDVTPKEVSDLVAKCFADFEAEGINDEDLARAKESIISGTYSSMESVAGKASLLTLFEMAMPGKKYTLENEINRYRNVTKEDIMRVFNKYIKGKNTATVIVEQHPALKENPNAKIEQYVSFNPYANAKDPNEGQFKGLVYNRPVDNFSRKNRPVVGPAVTAKVPDFYKYKMENGIEVIGTQTNETDMVYMTFNIKGGHLFETEKILPGTAVFTAAMLEEGGTKNYTAAEMEKEIQKLGSNISFNANDQSISVNVSCYKSRFKETLALLEQKLLYPNFDAADFKTVRKPLLESIRNQRTSAGIMANKGFLRLLYGNDNPLGTINTGEYKSASKITLNNAIDFYNTMMSPNLTRVIVAGNVNEAETKSNLTFLSTWKNLNLTLPKFTNFPEAGSTQIFLINKAFSKQSSMLMGYRALPYDVLGDFYKANIMNYVLAGNFNSRLNLNIREDKGWTYGINGRFSSKGKDFPGFYVISAGVKTSATD
ncbi:MAG: insulinase family protein, partial [Bacteroidia bacterium]|nr:insulinase family protein [Bacteroidia bacterium]